MKVRHGAVVFFGVVALLLILSGNRFVLTNDEGILLEPAQRMAQGARPYVDFFGYMSPGSYWVQAVLFRVFGAAYWVGRIPVILDFSLQCALVFALVKRLASVRAAVATVLVFIGFQIADPALLTAQHRWDSATLGLAAVWLALDAAGAVHRNFRLVASGALCAAAVWCTPSTLLLLAVITLWLFLSAERRSGAIQFLGGATAVTLIAASYLAVQGTLVPLIRQMLWLQKNYSRVNVMPYGSVIGGYSALLDGVHGLELVVRVLVVICLALPALLPLLALLLWGIARLGGAIPEELRSSIGLLLLAMGALTVSTFPRADLMHLALIAALPYALSAALIGRLLPTRVGAILAFTLMPIAVLFSFNSVIGRWNSQAVSSPTGVLRVPPELVPAMKEFLGRVHRGDSMFVYPYMPVHYFVTQARNPTRYSFLAPGMMTTDDEVRALAELQADPPKWLMYMQLSQEEFLRVFPNAKSVDWRFAALEKWFEENYQPVPEPGVNVGGYRLWERTVKSAPGGR